MSNNDIWEATDEWEQHNIPYFTFSEKTALCPWCGSWLRPETFNHPLLPQALKAMGCAAHGFITNNGKQFIITADEKELPERGTDGPCLGQVPNGRVPFAAYLFAYGNNNRQF